MIFAKLYNMLYVKETHIAATSYPKMHQRNMLVTFVQICLIGFIDSHVVDQSG